MEKIYELADVKIGTVLELQARKITVNEVDGENYHSVIRRRSISRGQKAILVKVINRGNYKRLEYGKILVMIENGSFVTTYDDYFRVECMMEKELVISNRCIWR